MKLEELVLPEGSSQFLCREFHVYYCGFCKLVLSAVGESSEKEQMVAASHDGVCPDCGGELNDLTLKHDRYLSHPGEPPYTDSRLRPKFPHPEPGAFDSTLRTSTLLFGIGPSFDNYPFSSRLDLFFGADARLSGHYACAHSALNGRVLFLDGGNTFNASHLRESVDPKMVDRVMDNTIVSRAFNYHQLTSLVVEKLPESVHSYRPTAIAVFEPTLLYEEDDVIDEMEAWFSFKRMAWTLRRVSASSPGIRVVMVVSDLRTKAGRMLQNICSEEAGRVRTPRLTQARAPKTEPLTSTL